MVRGRWNKKLDNGEFINLGYSLRIQHLTLTQEPQVIA
jgi:hypothetical protein